MPSANFHEAINSRTTDEVFIILLTLDQVALEEPIRISSDTRDVLSTGVRGVESQTFEWPYLPFELVLPNLEQDALPRCKLVVDNISREIIAAIDAMTSPPDLRIQIVLSSDPEVIEYDLQGLKMHSVTYNAFTIEGEFTIEYFMDEPYPAVRFTPSRFPGLFRGRAMQESV